LLRTLREDEFPGQIPTVDLFPHEPRHEGPVGTAPLEDSSTLQIEKSNVLLLGPSGVGKTLMAKTLARVLEVPFSISDCTPLTQAGYIGEDADAVIQRLLVASNYDVDKAERGIVCLDEMDKIATARVSHGKDVSGEGVQQALLKIIEGTTLQIQAKQERGGTSSRGSGGSAQGPGGFSQNPLGGGQSPSGKNEVFTVRTDNILFICAGAFNGLHKIIMDRTAKGSMGFGAAVRSSAPDAGVHETTMKGNGAFFRKHLPYYMPDPGDEDVQEMTYNALDLVEPADLQKYGMIPELVGRIPISCALSALDEEALVRVLTEPRNALTKQYEHLFSLSNIDLKFTSGALREMAKSAKGMGTGARGLRTVLERVLGESMFEAPGSPIRHILITERVAARKQAPIYLVRGQRAKFEQLIAAEEEDWQRRQGNQRVVEAEAQSFEEYRQKVSASGSS